MTSLRKSAWEATEALAKLSQHANATHRNIVGCNIVGRNMLRAFGHPVARCCVLLAQI